METRKASIRLRSVIDGEGTDYAYQGEYRQKGGVHCIVYTDYAGNALTKVAVEATESAMLLHRVGGVTSDMLFDPLTETVVKYDALSFRRGFLLHTDAYRLTPQKNGVRIDLKYRLSDGSGQPEIRGTQEIMVLILEDANL